MNDRSRRSTGPVGIVLLVAIMAGPATLPDVALVHRSEADANPRGTVSVSPPIAGPGDVIRVRSRILGGVPRPVVLQRARGKGWVAIASKRSTRAGRARFRTALPLRTGPRTYRYRVVAPRVRAHGLARVVTRARRVSVPAAPVVATDRLPDAIVGKDYAVTLVPGIPAPGTWSAGWLPAGLGLSAGGVLSGRPNAAGAFAFPVTLTDDHGQSATRVLTLTVRAPRWLALESGLAGSCGVKTDDSIWCWGAGALGQMGDGSTLSPRMSPVRVRGQGFVQVDTSGSTACGVKRDGSGWCWGDNSSGTVGDEGSGDVVLEPTQLPGPEWASIQVQGSTACGIRVSGMASCWGWNEHGQVGSGTRFNVEAPAELPGRWSSITIGYGTTCGVQTDGSGWCWGSNAHGQLGNGTFAPSYLPLQVPGTWRSITPGLLYPAGSGGRVYPPTTTCGVRTDHSGWCWGAGERGQIGDGATEDRSSLVFVGLGWESLGNRYGTTCGVKVDASAWCWGDNSERQTGTGSLAALVLVPMRLGALTWRSIVPGITSCGIGTEGSAWCWGRNDHGQVGDGTTTDASYPQLVSGADWSALGPTGVGATCGLKHDGTAWCWGANDQGQVGDETLTDRLTPHRLP